MRTEDRHPARRNARASSPPPSRPAPYSVRPGCCRPAPQAPRPLVRCQPSPGTGVPRAAESAFLGKYALFPARPGQQGAYIRRWREFGKICAARDGALLRHVSTADTARDLDLMRQDLGQPKLNYLGIFYGTFLGATYANLFPRRVGRLVLDGNVPPEAWTSGGRPNPRLSTYLRLGSDKAAARALAAFLRICGQRSTQACAFSAGNPAATRDNWDALLARLRRAPINLGGTAFTYAEVVTDVSDALPFVQPFSTPVPGNNFPGWSGAAQGLHQLWTARSGTASARPGTPPAAAVPAAQPYGGAEQDFAVQCNEAPSPPASAYAGLQRLVLRRSGVIGLPDLWTLDEPCATWPLRAGHLQRPLERPYQPGPGDRQHHRPVPPAQRRHRHDPPARQRPAPRPPRLRPHCAP